LLASDSNSAISEVSKNDEHDITKIASLPLGEMWYNLTDIRYSLESVATSNFLVLP
jgi:hypothetical protein